MNSFDFFNELLNQLEALQKIVNKIRELIKTHIPELRKDE